MITGSEANLNEIPDGFFEKVKDDSQDVDVLDKSGYEGRFHGRTVMKYFTDPLDVNQSTQLTPFFIGQEEKFPESVIRIPTCDVFDLSCPEDKQRYEKHLLSISLGESSLVHSEYQPPDVGQKNFRMMLTTSTKRYYKIKLIND